MIHYVKSLSPIYELPDNPELILLQKNMLSQAQILFKKRYSGCKSKTIIFLYGKDLQNGISLKEAQGLVQL